MADASGDPAAAFDAAFSRRNKSAIVRAETQGDEAFLAALFIACSPLAQALPEPLLQLQAKAQRASHNANSPLAMQRILEIAGKPVGRIMVDWNRSEGVSHGVDIAVMPQARIGAAGLDMLRAWTEVADALGLRCTLEVVSDNPARRIYSHLGFVADEELDPSSPVVSMQRPARAAT